MVELKVENISKKFHEKDVLRGIGFNTNEEQFLVVVGPPGAGKTTLLKIIAGLIRPDHGGIFVEGRDITNLPAGERGIGMVFENPAIYPDRTGYENIAFPLRIKKMGEDEIKRKVTEITKKLQISHILDRRPASFSGGELQRVALARVLVREPGILLLDEPLKNLDAKIREKMRVELKRLQRELRITTIFSTHDQLEAMTVGDKVIVMNAGQVEQFDVPERVYTHPDTSFVARFIGSPPMNTFPCTLKIIEDRFLLDAEDFSVDISAYDELKRKATTTEKLVVGVRPEDLVISKAMSDSNTVEARVHTVQKLGDEQIAAVTIRGSSANVLLDQSGHVDMDDTIYLGFNPESFHLFDAETGKAIG